MTRDETRTAAKVMMAFADGSDLEMRERGEEAWQPTVLLNSIFWNWNTIEYRIKPKKHEVWLWIPNEGDFSGLAWPSKEACIKAFGTIGGRAVRFVEAT